MQDYKENRKEETFKSANIRIMNRSKILKAHKYAMYASLSIYEIVNQIEIDVF